MPRFTPLAPSRTSPLALTLLRRQPVQGIAGGINQAGSALAAAIMGLQERRREEQGVEALRGALQGVPEAQRPAIEALLASPATRGQAGAALSQQLLQQAFPDAGITPFQREQLELDRQQLELSQQNAQRGFQLDERQLEAQQRQFQQNQAFRREDRDLREYMFAHEQALKERRQAFEEAEASRSLQLMEDQEERLRTQPRSEIAQLIKDRRHIQEQFGKGSPQDVAMGEYMSSLQRGEPPKLSDVRGMRQEFSGLSKDFVTARDAFKKIQSIEPTPAGDIALVFSYMKVLDPPSTVREGEKATVENAGNISSRVRNLYNRALTGESLTPEQRADLKKQAENQFQTLVDSHLDLEGEFRGMADRAGFNPQDVVIDFVGDLRPQDTPSGGSGQRRQPQPPQGQPGTPPAGTRPGRLPGLVAGEPEQEAQGGGQPQAARQPRNFGRATRQQLESLTEEELDELTPEEVEAFIRRSRELGIGR